jgi:MFS family permease
MLAVLRRRNFALLWSGGVLSHIGDLLLFLALPFHTFQLTGSALATGGMFIAQSIPSLLFGSLAGVYADRWNRRRTLIAADLLRALVLLPLVLIRSPDAIWLVYVIAFAEQTIGEFFHPARGALLPQIVPDDQVLAANGLSSLAAQVVTLVTPLIGAGLLQAFGFASVVLIDSASYLLSALLIAFISVQPTARHHTETRSAVWRDLRNGLLLARRERWIGGLLGVMALVMLAQGLINVSIVPLINGVLGGGASELGWLVTAQGVGGVLGGVALSRWGRQLRPPTVIACSLWTVSVGWLVIAQTEQLPIVLLMIAINGVAVVGFFTAVPTMVQTGIADEFRGRILGAFGTMEALMLLIGMGLGSVLADRVGVRVVLTGVAALAVVAGSFAILLPRERVRT